MFIGGFRLKEYNLYINDEYIGTYAGATFKDAVLNWGIHGLSQNDSKNYEPFKMTYMGYPIEHRADQ